MLCNRIGVDMKPKSKKPPTLKMPTGSMECIGLSIATKTAQPRETTRYLLMRARELWPAAFVEDSIGDQYSQHSTAMPSRCTLVSKPGDLGRKRERATTPWMSVEVAAHAILFTFDNKHLEARSIAEHLADDPIWGPSWSVAIQRDH